MTIFTCAFVFVVETLQDCAANQVAQASQAAEKVVLAKSA
jgi:hypothetical protein